MKSFVLVLHFYQPPTQKLAITKAILESCYLPLLRMLAQKDDIGVTCNFSGSLLEQLEQLHATEFFELVKSLVDSKKIELLNSAMYHSLLPISPPEIFQHQIQLDQAILSRLFGVGTLSGFFPPELAVDDKHVSQLKARYVIVNQSATKNREEAIVKFKDKTLLVANQELVEICRSYPGLLPVKPFVQYVIDQYPTQQLFILPSDAELFGHHYAERLQFLSDFLDNPEIEFLTGTQAVAKFGSNAKSVQSIEVSSWQTGEKLDLWQHNPLQKKYFQLAQLCAQLVVEHSNAEAIQLVNQGWASCYQYWLSNTPWWHPDLVEGGAHSLVKSVRASSSSFEEKKEAERLYFSLLLDIWTYHWSDQVKKGYEEHNRERELLLENLPKLS